MASRAQKLLLAALLTLCATVSLAGERVTSGRIHFMPGGEKPELMIVLDSNPAVLEPIPSYTDAQAMAAYRARLMQTADWPYEAVEIRIPLLQYGSGGSFTNAYISRGEGVSFDPATYSATNEVFYVGTVTVTEFTRDVLAGEYSAGLYRPGKEPREVEFVETVSGWFRISSPVQHDPRANRELSETEQLRMNASAVWQTLNGVGLGLEDAETFAGGGGTVSIPAGARVLEPECVCECDALIQLPEDHACIRPEGDCYGALQICRDYGFDQVTGPSSADVEEILDYTLGKNAPETTRSAMRASIEEMSPEERAEVLKGLRQAAAQLPGSEPALPAEAEQIRSALESPDAVTPPGAVPVNPDWDAETLRYKAAVEQLGLPPDLVEDTVEMFHNNDAAMRQTLWDNVERLRERKR